MYLNGRGRAARGRRSFLLASAVAAVTGTTSLAPAADLYWDTNGSLSGGANAGAANGTWNTTSTLWSADPLGGGPTQTWNNDGSATAVFAAGTDATSAYTVSLGNFSNFALLKIGGMRFEEGSVSIMP